ncbi:MAG: hypothetical protein WA902_19855 [Thermosynechococcaceae cyanobacterium]
MGSTTLLVQLKTEGTASDRGGELVAYGTPEEVAKVKKFYTGQYLKQVLALHPPQTISAEFREVMNRLDILNVPLKRRQTTLKQSNKSSFIHRSNDLLGGAGYFSF